MTNPKAKKPLTAAEYRAIGRVKANATERSYTTGFKGFQKWCEDNGHQSLPPKPDVVADFLAHLAVKHPISTIRLRLSAIRHTCITANVPFDSMNIVIRDTIAGIARAKDYTPQRSTPLMLEQVRTLVSKCGADIVGTRNRAIILLAFAGALRRSEIVALQVEDIRWTPEGAEVFIAKSKEDQTGIGASIFLPKGQPETCPYQALKNWLEISQLGSGPLFRKISTAGKLGSNRLHSDAIRRILGAVMKRANLQHPEDGRYSPHSFRAGFITTAHAAGVSDEKIMEHTRHKQIKEMRGYVHRDKIKGRAVEKIGL